MYERSKKQMKSRGIALYLILQVIRVLPHIDEQQRHKTCEKHEQMEQKVNVLIMECFLNKPELGRSSGSWFGVEDMRSWPVRGQYPSQPQPEPITLTDAFESNSRNVSTEPKVLVNAISSSAEKKIKNIIEKQIKMKDKTPGGLETGLGVRFCQYIEWFTWPP